MFLISCFKIKKTLNKRFPVATDMYTDARTDFSRARANKNATILDNMNNLDFKTIDALKKYGVNPDERGVYYNENSNVSKKFANSKELQRVFDENLEDIKKGTFNGADLNFDASLGDAILNQKKFDRYASIQHAKMPAAYIDEQGRMKARIIDKLDYAQRPDKTLKDMIKNYPNNHGYSLQEKGALENYFTIIDILIEEEKKKDLFNKLRKN